MRGTFIMTNTGADAEDFGYLALFDPEGNPIEASREDLLSIEAMSFDEELHRRVVDNRSGRYWLISNRPGFHAMLLEVSIFHCYPREEDKWSISYCTNGIASYEHWDLEGALNTFRRKKAYNDPADSAPIPENVVEIARQHVSYRLGRTPGPDPLDRHGVRTRDAVDMRERLTQYLEGKGDPTDFIRQLAGKRVAVFELALAISFFCLEHGLDPESEEVFRNMLEIVVPEEQHERLLELLGTLEDQLGSE
jgi:hypothetical protein